jgi:hypothetical protein
METRLTTSQADAFCHRVRPMLRFLFRCRKRLDARGFDPKSKLYKAVANAYEAMHSLHVELHYESVGQGVGRPRNEDEPISDQAPPPSDGA